MKRGFNLQSAMEYLMAYGWAILIVAVVLAVLFGLGFFNSASLAPKVAAGSCQVYKPMGPGTTSFINLEGTCNNELPQYVAQFNGASSFINITPITAVPAVNSPKTISAWINIPATSGSYDIVDFVNVGTAADQFRVTGGNLEISKWGGGILMALSFTSVNTWHMITYTYDGTTSTIYLDGSVLGTSANAPQSAATKYIMFGNYQSTGAEWYKGYLSNVQVYNTSLSANEVTALYQEGIGGDPIEINNLVGWWPLNGNANDYSGNLNNGVPTSMVFTSSWTSGYSAP